MLPCPNNINPFYLFFVLLFSNEGMPLQAEGPTDTGAPLSLDSALQERLQQEMELLEKRKNEEMQNLKTSLIAEQQVSTFLR